MTEFLTTQGTAYYLEHIITKANKWMVLISPYLQLSKILFERIEDADKRNVKTILVCRQGSLQPEDRSKLQRLKNLSLHFLENLHAKAYLNEDCVVVTSMNIYEFSEKNNREMGILIRKEEDSKAFDDAMKEVKSIIDSSTIDDLTKKTVDYHEPKNAQGGYCIRCRTSIPLDPGKPYCFVCFLDWEEWGNPFYEDDYCHACGRPSRASMAKPLCGGCYEKLR